MVCVAGGETVVTLDAKSGMGGRCQELALAFAEATAGAAAFERIALLAAGTDGRDGPTDAAGAIVDDRTWGLISAAGRDPKRDLHGHDAYRALSAVGSLLHRRSTGTNVNDLAIGLIR
jgi:glycerate-2-kinase